jgi:hypothetical protein
VTQGGSTTTTEQFGVSASWGISGKWLVWMDQQPGVVDATVN